ncbi:MAG: primosomal protein N' [Clostridia bacterium]|nr:primosomal protein N' [Clostridia bacterium]
MADNSFEYASVYLLDAPYCIDSKYDYFIPLDMRKQIMRGSFVTVPFGRGNRKQMAVVWELHHCPYSGDIKTISELCADRAVLDEELLSLCDYMKEHYLCTFGEAVRCAVPASALGKMSEYYYPIPSKGPDASAGFAPADLFVYNYLCSTGGKSFEALKTKFGAGVAAEAVKKLLAKGYIGKELIQGKTASDAFEAYYSLAITPEECEGILMGKGAVKLRSEKHKAILSALLREGEAVSAVQLIGSAEVTTAQLKALVDKGLICLEQRRIWRQPYEICEENKIEYKLNAEQQAAFETVKVHLEADKASAILLHGVTGSGKTSVIIRAIDEALDSGKGVLMLLPEIALTPQTLKIFSTRYGDRIALVHSGLSAGERYDSYVKIRSGKADLVIGTRSAIFAPVKNLGLVIIDEEHETTYKSETSPKYHARDVARWRCVYNNAVLLLASATPSIESYTKAMDGKYTLVKLRERYGGAELPEVVIYDMRNEQRTGNMSPIGRVLREELKNVTDRDEQAILFLNRRGYNTSVSCKSCGQVVTCPHCSISMNYHTRKGNYDQGFLFCHWCGQKLPMPKTCPSCSSEHLVKIGFGTQRIEQEMSELLPDKTVIRMDADSTAAKNSLEGLLTEFKERRADVLLGTQMVTKGHDFPDVTLVGVLLADMSLYMDDYHANERTFSMLTQVIGRAGRSKKKGMAIIQTNNPDNDTIRLACKQDYEAFYASEIRLRKLLVFPPYCDIALLTLTGTDEKQVLIGANVLRQEINKLIFTRYRDIQMVIFGPFESPVYKVEEKYRMRLVIKCRLNRESRELFATLLSDFGSNSKGKTALSIDFNPTGL